MLLELLLSTFLLTQVKDIDSIENCLDILVEGILLEKVFVNVRQGYFGEETLVKKSFAYEGDFIESKLRSQEKGPIFLVMLYMF